MDRPDFNAILDGQPIATRYIDPGYLNANSVWQVTTGADKLIVKISRLQEKPEGPFWHGLNRLFNFYPYEDMDKFPLLTDFVRLNTDLAVPEFVRIDTSMKRLPQKYMIVQCMPGKSPAKSEITPLIAAQLGAYLGRLHKVQFSQWGNFYHDNRNQATLWGERLADALVFLAERFFGQNQNVQDALQAFQNAARNMLCPDNFSLVMPDFFWSQFLVRDGNLSAVVDLEAMVIGPRELDLLCCEYLLDERLIPAFVQAYERYLPTPNLQPVRALYRFLYYLMEIEETYSFNQWMNHPSFL